MTATPSGDPARSRCRMLRPRPRGPARSPHSRRRAVTRTLARPREFSLRPSTLWPFADAEPQPGTARLAGWFGRAILTIVTGYTRPGDRVLLLAPPAPPPRAPARVLIAAGATNPYEGLTEAVWTITRLGRGTDIATARPAPDYPDNPADGSVSRGGESESGPRPSRLGHRTSTAAESDPGRGDRRPDGTFELIITAVQPQATGWLAYTDWDALLAAAGVLAVVTHSDRVGGRCCDPVSAIVSTVRSERRGWLEHIAVLDHPLPPAPRIDAAPTHSPTGQVKPAPLTEPQPLRSVHHDLLLFGPVPHKNAERNPPERAGSSDG